MLQLSTDLRSSGMYLQHGVQVPALPAKDWQPALTVQEQQKLLESSELRPTDAEDCLPPAGGASPQAPSPVTGGACGAQGVLYSQEQSMLRELAGIFGAMEGGSGLHLHELLAIINVRELHRRYDCSSFLDM